MSPAWSGRLLDLAALSVCGLIWGTTWFAITLQLGEVDPAVSVAYRFGIAAFVLMGVCAWCGRSLRLAPRQHLLLAGQGLFTFSFQYVLVYLAEERIVSALVAVVYSLLAPFNLLVFRFVLDVRARAAAWTGALLGSGGVVLLSLEQIRATALVVPAVIGLALALASVACSVAGNVFADRANHHGVAIVPGTAWSMLYGTLGIALAAVATGSRWTIPMSVDYLGSLIYLAIVGSVVAFLVFYSLARRAGFNYASYVGAIVPLIAMGVSATFEDMKLTSASIASIVLVLAGQVLFLRARARP